MPAPAGQASADTQHVAGHLTDYEEYYDLPVQHRTRVQAVHRDGERLLVEADNGTWRASGGPTADVAARTR